MAKQNDNNAVLADVVCALRDINSVVLVDTVVDSMSSGCRPVGINRPMVLIRNQSR